MIVKFFLKQNTLSEEIWQLENETKLALKEKIENGSITINRTTTINIYRGVTTGYNPAFIIDEEIKVIPANCFQITGKDKTRVTKHILMVNLKNCLFNKPYNIKVIAKNQEIPIWV